MREDTEHLRQTSLHPDQSSVTTNEAVINEIGWHCRRGRFPYGARHSNLSMKFPVTGWYGGTP